MKVEVGGGGGEGGTRLIMWSGVCGVLLKPVMQFLAVTTIPNVFTVNRQIASNLTVNRQKAIVFTVNRQRQPPIITLAG